MDPRLLTLYEQELRYFRESSAEFARAFPKIASRLGIEGQEVADPYVERLIEATAFLAARVGLKLDAEYPRFTGHLLDIVYPHFLAPTPSMAVVSLACDPDDANLANGPTLPRGSGLRARQAVGQNTHCEFRTSRALRVWPIEVQRAQYFTYAPDLPLAQHPQSREIRGGLRIALRATAGLQLRPARAARPRRAGVPFRRRRGRGLAAARMHARQADRRAGAAAAGCGRAPPPCGSCPAARCRRSASRTTRRCCPSPPPASPAIAWCRSTSRFRSASSSRASPACSARCRRWRAPRSSWWCCSRAATRRSRSW